MKLAAILAALFVLANEIRGLVLAAPVLVGLWLSGGDLIKIGIGLAMLAGIVLTMIVPTLFYRLWKRKSR